MPPISRGLMEGLAVRAIARALRRAPLTVSRGIGRSGGVMAYRAVRTEQAASRRAVRPTPCKLGQAAPPAPAGGGAA
jgi:IS30 family transposase